MKILIIDNYDSFTYNLAHYIEGIIDDQVTVMRNDHIDFEILPQFERIVISPGPGLPEQSGDLMRALELIPDSTTVLAVCLGMQAYALTTGGAIYNLDCIHHGVQVRCDFDNTAKLFQGVEEKGIVGLYHSWAVESPLPKEWRVTARSEEGVIMAMEHLIKPVHCVQFHPESVLTPDGRRMVANFIHL